jgi:CrcB protein
MTPLDIAAIALAGGAGAGLRYVLDRLIQRGRPNAFPLGILVVNVTGSLALGIVVGLGAGIVPEPWHSIIGIGLLGGYTTFSTVSVETVLLAQRRRRAWALLNVAGTLVAALAAAFAGLLIGGALAA